MVTPYNGAFFIILWFEPDFIKFMCNKIPLRPLVFLQIVLTVESHSNSYQIIGYCYREILANTKTCETHAKLLQVAVLRNLFLHEIVALICLYSYPI